MRIAASSAFMAVALCAGAAFGQYDGKVYYNGQLYPGSAPSGTGAGGPFKFTAAGGLETKIQGLGKKMGSHQMAANQWLTFCLEKNENIGTPSSTQFYDAKIDTHARAGGEGNLHPGTGYSHGKAGAGEPDPLDPRTAFLYSKYMAGTLNLIVTEFSYNSATSGAALQRVIWFFENEESSVPTATTPTLEQQLVDAANNSGWTDIGNVRVLNLYNGPGQNAYGNNQSQLVIIPLPTAGGMALAGVFGLAVLRRRR